MAASLKHWEDDNTLYLFTSLTSGSSLILSNTNRIETILLNARIPFTHIDTATDESAKRLFQRRGKGKKLPFLVKEGFVLGTFEEVEEWNEYGELKEMIGEVGSGHERSVETAPANKTLKPVDFSREMGIMPSIQGTLNGASSTLTENVKPKATSTSQQQQNNVMKSLAEEAASAAKSRGPINLKSAGAKKETTVIDSKAEKASRREQLASRQDEQPESVGETATEPEVLKSLSEAASKESSTNPAAEKTEQAVSPSTVPLTKDESTDEQADVATAAEIGQAQPADVQEHLPSAHGNEDPDLAQPSPLIASETKQEDREAAYDEVAIPETHEKPSGPVEGTSSVEGAEDPHLAGPEPSKSEIEHGDESMSESKQLGLGQASVTEQTKSQAEPAVEKVEAIATSTVDEATAIGSTAEDKIQPVVEAAQAQVSDAMDSAREVAEPIAEKATATVEAVESTATDTMSKVAENIPSTTEVEQAVTGLGVSLGHSTTQVKDRLEDTADQIEQAIERPSTPPARPTNDEVESEPKTPEPPQTPVKKTADTPGKLNPVTPQVAPSKQFKMEKKERKPEDGSPKPIHDQFMHFFF